MPKKDPYVTDGKRLYRVSDVLPGGRGAVLEDARTEQVTCMPMKQFLSLTGVRERQKGRKR